MTRTANSKRIIGWADKGIKYKRIIRWRPTGQNKLWWHLMAKLWKEYLRPAFPTKTTLMLEGLRYILTFSFSPPPTHCLIYLFYSHSLPPSLLSLLTPSLTHSLSIRSSRTGILQTLLKTIGRHISLVQWVCEFLQHFNHNFTALLVQVVSGEWGLMPSAPNFLKALGSPKFIAAPMVSEWVSSGFNEWVREWIVGVWMSESVSEWESERVSSVLNEWVSEWVSDWLYRCG